ncbi:hypothetical protein BLNAU_11442 [Blattamonas nauphoetae]|uniref:Protein kinase domain-containing protein n=1 Tax=Blattamonas nauphoetae TaxID=2049346 RepID=A0ABQ9XMD8_9EUKA|nr:hypothetical protein BLNAU_11442 [Blattamonas nauphoetae]
MLLNTSYHADSLRISSTCFEIVGRPLTTIVHSSQLSSEMIQQKYSLTRGSFMSNADVSTVVHSVSIVNVTSSQSKPLIPPKRLSQTCSGVSVSHSVGALQNTIVQDHNLGGSLLCQNTTIIYSQSTATSLRDASIASAFAPLLSEHLKELNPPYDFTDDQYENELSHLYWSITKFTSIKYPQVHKYATAITHVTYTNCSFIRMTEDTSDSVWKGGAALRHVCQAPLTITNCRFEECHSEKGSGGAILVDQTSSVGSPTFLIDSSSFDRCSSVSQGGAIVITYPALVSITHTSFTQCRVVDSQGIRAGYGGGVWATTCSVSFSEFVGNTAMYAAGLYADSSASLVFCHFAENIADGDCDFIVKSPFDYLTTVFGCTESSDPSSSTDKVLFVESGAAGTDCSYSSPCGSLSSALSKVSSSQIKTIKVGAGSYGTVSLVASSYPTVTQYLSKDSAEMANHVLSFSLKVDVHTILELKRMHLRPLPGLALVSCSRDDANVTLDSLQIIAIADISTAPFSFSAGVSAFTYCHFEDLSSMQCSLIDITASAVVSLEHCFFSRIDGSSSVITAVDGELDLRNCVFRSLTRTSGNGAAGLDCLQPSLLSIYASFAHCHSTGLCGALLLNQTDPSNIQDFAITFFDNRGRDDTVAHDIHLIGMVVSDLDIYSSSLRSLSLIPSAVDDSAATHTFYPLTSIKVNSDWKLYARLMYIHEGFSSSDLESTDLSQMNRAGDPVFIDLNTLPEQINRMRPITILGTIEVYGTSFVSDHSILAQSEGSTGSLITFKPSSNGVLRNVRLLTNTQHTDPMIVVEKEASLRVESCFITSDGTTSNRAIIRSWGNVNVNDVWFSNINFVGGSCFETFGGSITIQHSGSHIVVSNLTTTENGAFINSHNTSLDLQNLTIFNCHATNGGAVFARDCPSISMQNLFYGCSATQNGGGVCVEGVGCGESPSLMIGPCSFVDCSAVFGGGLFVNTSNYTCPSFGGGIHYNILDIDHYFRAFSGCSAQKGAGLFLDGSDMTQLSLLFHTILSNDDAVCEGSDFFFSQSVAESIDDLSEVLTNSFNSAKSFSGRSMDETGRFKHVEVGGYPDLSFNLPPPILEVLNWDNPPSEDCVLSTISCTSIHMYLPLFHTKTENGGYLPIPIYLNERLFFFESGVVRKQATVVKTLIDEWPPAVSVEVQLGSGVVTDCSPFLNVAEEGSLEFSRVNFVWRIENPLCSSLDATATIAITECNFEIHTSLTIPFIMCSCGSLVIKQTSFTTPTPKVIASPLITSISVSTPTSNNELNLRIEMSHVTFRDFTMDIWANCVVFFENPDWMKLDHVNFDNVVKTDTYNAFRMFVQGYNLANVIEYVPNNGFPERGGELDTLYESLDEAEPEGSLLHSPTLLLYLSLFRAPTIIVKSIGRDGIWCGDDHFPCASLDESDRHLADSVLCTIAIVDVAELKGEVDLTPDKTGIVSKGGSKVTVAVSTDGSLVNKADTITHSLALESLLFSLTSDRSSPLLRSESGLMTITSCSFTSSSAQSSLLVSVTGGVFEMSKVDFTSVHFSAVLLTFSNFESIGLLNVSHKSCSSGSLMTFEGASDLPQIELRDSVFTGPTTQSSQNDDTLCAWSSSLVVVNSCSFDSYSSSFSHLSQGALHVRSSKVKIVGGQMADNNPHSSSFPNMNRNIRCEGASSIELDTSPSDSDTLWINTDSECVVKGNTGSEVLNSFFVPTLTPTSCSATFTKKTKEYSIVMKGTLLIPCGLAFVISDVANTNTEPVRIPLSAETTSELTESSITMTLLSNDVSELEAKNEWFGYFEFGQTGKTDSFTFKLSQKQAQSLAMQKTLPWLIPLIVSLVVLLLLALFIVICCRRRKTRNQQNSSEMNEQHEIQVEDEKMEVVDDIRENLHAIDQVESVTKCSPDDTNRVHNRSNFPSLPIQETLVEALVCSEKMEVSVVREVDTLYNALHVNERKRTFAKRAFQKQLALGLTTLAGSNKPSDVLTKLSSHWVMFDAQGNACLKSQEPTQQIPLPQSSGGTQPVTASKDGQRWRAPEVAKAEEENDFGRLIDEHKASVFSLGLILWEIETGLVPFGELDAINAQRQIGTGTLPKMEGVNSRMVDVIESCLRLEPDDRPTLSTIWTALHSIPDEAQIPKDEIVGTH